MTVAQLPLHTKRQQQAEQIYQLLLANRDGLTMRAIASFCPDIPRDAIPRRLALLVRMGQVELHIRISKSILYTAVEAPVDAD